MAEPLPLGSRRWASALVVATVALQPVQAQPSWQSVSPQLPPGGQSAAGLPQWQRIPPANPIPGGRSAPGGRQGTPIWQPLPRSADQSKQLVWEPVAPVAAESKPGIGSPGAKPGSPLPQGWTVAPFVRAHAQSAASFYLEADNNPFPSFAPRDQLQSQDQRLSAFGGGSLGVKLSKYVTPDVLVDFRYERYEQHADWYPFGSQSRGIDPFMADIYQVGVSWYF